MFIHFILIFLGFDKLSSGMTTLLLSLCTISEEQGLVVSVPVKTVVTTIVVATTGIIFGGIPGLAVGKILELKISTRTK